MLPVSPVYAGNAEFIEDLYERFLTSPASVAEEWRRLFSAMKGADSPVRAEVPQAAVGLNEPARAARPRTRPRWPSRSR